MGLYVEGKSDYAEELQAAIVAGFHDAFGSGSTLILDGLTVRSFAAAQ